MSWSPPYLFSVLSGVKTAVFLGGSASPRAMVERKLRVSAELKNERLKPLPFNIALGEADPPVLLPLEVPL